MQQRIEFCKALNSFEISIDDYIENYKKANDRVETYIDLGPFTEKKVEKTATKRKRNDSNNQTVNKKSKQDNASENTVKSSDEEYED